MIFRHPGEFSVCGTPDSAALTNEGLPGSHLGERKTLMIPKAGGKRETHLKTLGVADRGTGDCLNLIIKSKPCGCKIWGPDFRCHLQLLAQGLVLAAQKCGGGEVVCCQFLEVDVTSNHPHCLGARVQANLGQLVGVVGEKELAHLPAFIMA